jgi:hypothetical protein
VLQADGFIDGCLTDVLVNRIVRDKGWSWLGSALDALDKLSIRLGIEQLVVIGDGRQQRSPRQITINTRCFLSCQDVRKRRFILLSAMNRIGERDDDSARRLRLLSKRCPSPRLAAPIKATAPATALSRFPSLRLMLRD